MELANFIALQTARAPGLRRSMNDASTQIARTMPSIVGAQPDDQLRSTAREVTGEELDDEELAALPEVMSRGDVIVRHHNNDTMVLFQASEELVQPFADMRWTLLDAQELGVHHNRSTHRALAARWSSWMDVRGTTERGLLVVPVSPSHAHRMEFVWAESGSPELVSASGMSAGSQPLTKLPQSMMRPIATRIDRSSMCGGRSQVTADLARVTCADLGDS